MIFPPPPAPCPPVADRRAAGDCDLLLPRDFPPQAGCGLLLLQLTAEKGLRDEPLEFTPREEETVDYLQDMGETKGNILSKYFPTVISKGG